jgi:hypothetical protein
MMGSGKYLAAWIATAVVAGVSAACGAFAQTQHRPVVTATVVPDSMAIGDRFDIRVRVAKDAMQIVEFPVFDREQKNGLEFVAESGVDTLSREGRRMVLEKRYTMTTFDEGRYSLGRVSVFYADKNMVDTLWSADSLHLTVTTFEIDTARQQIFDVKAPLRAPFRLGEIWLYLLLLLGGMALLAFIIWFAINYRKVMPAIVARVRPAEPPHVVALRELDRMAAQRMWVTEQPKSYYTALTDVVREYIGRRYRFGAMEMTSEEIVGELRGHEVDKRSMESLGEMFATSDLVKFAKYQATSDEGAQSYAAARRFVEQTREIEATPVTKEEGGA